jgi:imidazolonepropionase-like amidohydrolase
MPPLVIRGGLVLPVASDPIEDGMLVIEDGRIAAVGRALAVPDGATVVEARDQVIVPGLIDAHTHLGVHEEAEGWAGQDTNEMTDPVTAQVRALDAINPADLGFRDAVAGGVLAVNVQPGSGNVFGGQTAAILTYGRRVDEMVLRQPSGLKSATGENPKRVYSDQKKAPSTRLAVASIMREWWTKAQDYTEKQRLREPDKPFERDLRLESLGRVLAGEIPWRVHSHRADDIATALRVAEEFGVRIVIDHGTEAWLLGDVLAARGVPVVIGPLLTSRSKVELRQRSLRNPGRLAAAGVEIAITTDHPVVPVQYLIYQAILSVKDGLDRETALRAVTLTPARIMGVGDQVGSLEPGKRADFALWSGHPLDVMSRVGAAYIGGERVYEYDAATGAERFPLLDVR